MYKLINANEAAKMVGCDVKWIRRAIDCKLLRGWKFGKNYKTTAELLEAFMASCEGQDVLSTIKLAAGK